MQTSTTASVQIAPSTVSVMSLGAAAASSSMSNNHSHATTSFNLNINTTPVNKSVLYVNVKELNLIVYNEIVVSWNILEATSMHDWIGLFKTSSIFIISLYFANFQLISKICMFILFDQVIGKIKVP